MAGTEESDACFLIPRADGSWRIGIWFRQWATREEYDQDVPTWLVGQAEGVMKIPGLPLHVRGGFAPEDPPAVPAAEATRSDAAPTS
ncbi:hypothetical protein [Kitasatospora sp. MAP5-34]|uniref:hypothetical protein n=1 Tax=Kitasatospora sp. MAP5-34 TaxID=3035102 RepID=UPI00247340B3|nr:hypothetical protein [Kitasatospora sp. MAP5-34]MDH6578610.1 hypothetical protein [Kitasatospora sp. MAP5-34]